jgi:NAD(P)-dependent dehydrogenase (short-subunit alcohol dehydrogenase family)
MMAKALALNGASRVYIVGRRLEKLQEAAKLSPHNNIIPLQGDVTSQESLEAIARRVRSEVGHVHLLVCNSGVTGPQTGVNLPKGTSAEDLQRAALQSPMSDFTQTFAVNVSGVYYNAMAFLDLLVKGSEDRYNPSVMSQVIITGSNAAFNRNVGAGIAYNASKAGVTQMMKILAGLYSPYSVRVNVIAPGSLSLNFLET